MLETTFRGADGAFRVIDFAPRFLQHERSFRPTMILRVVEPIEGSPRVVVRCEPVLGWSRREPTRLEGSNHVRFEGYERPLRLTTDVPLAYLHGQPFVPAERNDTSFLLDFYVIEKCVYEIGYELHNRPDWIDIPLRGLLDLVRARRGSSEP